MPETLTQQQLGAGSQAGVDEHRHAGDVRAVVIAAIIFAALSTWAGVASEGFLEADACTHYQYSRFVFQEPYRLIDVWGRPWCTWIYAYPAWLAGRDGVHVMSLAIALAIAWVTRRIAVLQGYRWPALAFVFVLSQPLVFLHSFSELTELPFAILLAVAFLAYRERRWWEMALVAGAMPLARPEGFGFILMAAAALVLHRRWWWVALLPVPLVVWDFGGWVMSGQHGPWWRWLVSAWPYSGDSLYKPGHLLHFVWFLPAIVGPFVFPALVVGIATTIASAPRRLRMTHEQRCDVLITMVPLMVLAGHSVLYWRGKMASNGELRYLLILAPFWGLLLARGWEWVWVRTGWRRVMRWAAVAALLPVWVNIPKIGYKTLPLVMMPDWKQGGLIAQWYDEWELRQQYPYLMNSHPGVPYAMGISPTDTERMRWWTKQVVSDVPDGTLLIWDPVYGVYNAEADRSVSIELIEQAGWVEIKGPDVSMEWGTEYRFFVSPRAVDGRQIETVGAKQAIDGG